MNTKNWGKKSGGAACGGVYMVVTDSYTLTELRGLNENPTQFLVHCLILSNKYLTLNLQQGRPELMTVVNTAGLSPAEGRSKVTSRPWPLSQMSFSFAAEPNNDEGSEAVKVRPPVATPDPEYATAVLSFTLFIMMQKETSSTCRNSSMF